MAQPFDVFLPCAEKDFPKLPYIIDSVQRDVQGYDNIVVCCPAEPPNLGAKVELWLDKEVLDIDVNGWKFRPNWNYQQCLKLFQEVTSDWYLTVDCDTIINRPLSFWEDRHPVWYYGWPQENEPYFEFQRQMIGIGRVAGFSFISDMCLINRNIVCRMLQENGLTIDKFIAKSQLITNPTCYMAEPELYGSYCYVKEPWLYRWKKLRQSQAIGLEQRPGQDNVWTDDGIRARIDSMRNQDVDTFSMHSWFIESEEQWSKSQ